MSQAWQTIDKKSNRRSLAADDPADQCLEHEAELKERPAILGSQREGAAGREARREAEGGMGVGKNNTSKSMDSGGETGKYEEEVKHGADFYPIPVSATCAYLFYPIPSRATCPKVSAFTVIFAVIWVSLSVLKCIVYRHSLCIFRVI